MVKNKFTEEVDNAMLREINSKIKRHTIQLLNRVDGRLKPFGSGVFAKIYNDFFIITASHVVSLFEEYPDDNLSIRVSTSIFVKVLGDINYTVIKKGGDADLAYIKLDEQIIEPLLKVYTPVTIDKFRNHNNLVYAFNYCVLGFPAVNVSKDGEPFNTSPSLYLTIPTNDNPYEYYKHTKRDFIILGMKGKGTDIKTNKKLKINTQLHGISGCGLWLLLITTNPLTGKIEVDYRLVGIMTDIRTGRYFCLIANKIILIIEALKIFEKYEFNERISNFVSIK